MGRSPAINLANGLPICRPWLFRFRPNITTFAERSVTNGHSVILPDASSYVTAISRPTGYGCQSHQQTRAGERVRWMNEAVGSGELSRAWESFRYARSLDGSKVMKLWRRELSTVSTGVSVQCSASPCPTTVPAVTSHTEDVMNGFDHTCSCEPRCCASQAKSGTRGAAIKQHR